MIGGVSRYGTRPDHALESFLGGCRWDTRYCIPSVINGFSMNKPRIDKRRWVNRKERDGELKFKDSKYSLSLVVDDGKRSEKNNIPRYANPWMGDRARAWTYGWNVSHGPCKKCSRCAVGNKKIKEINDQTGLATKIQQRSKMVI